MTEVTQSDIENLSAYLGSWVDNLGEALGTQRGLLQDDYDQFVDLASTLDGFSVEGLLPDVGELAREAVASIQLNGLERLFVADGGLFDPSSYVRDIGSFVDRRTGSFAGEAFSLIARIVQEGQSAYLALAYNQIFQVRERIRDQRMRINNQVRGCNELLRALNNVYGDGLFKKLDANRRAAIAFILNAEIRMDRVAEDLGNRGVFNSVLYDLGMTSVTGAQASLTAGPRRDRVRYRGTHPVSEESTLDVLGFIPELVIPDEIFDETIEDVRRSLQEGGEGFTEDVVNPLPSIVSDALTETLGNLAQRYTSLLSLAGSMTIDGNQILRGHRRVLLRLRAIQTLEDEIGNSRTQLAPIRDEILAFSDRLENLREDMEGDKNRVEIMTQTPEWLARLSFMKLRMEQTISPSTREALRAASAQNVLDEQYARVAQRLAEVEIPSTEEVEAITQEGNDILIEFTQSLGGRDDIPEDLIRRIRTYRSQLTGLSRQYGALERAMSGVIPRRHALVDSLNTLIGNSGGLLDGLRYLVDAGRWTVLGRFNAQLVTSAGLLEFTLRKAIFGIVLPPNVQSLIDRLLNILTVEREQADAEVAMRQEAGESLQDGIEATVRSHDERTAIIDDFDRIRPELTDIAEKGRGALSEDTLQSIQSDNVVLALG